MVGECDHFKAMGQVRRGRGGEGGEGGGERGRDGQGEGQVWRREMARGRV